MKRENRRMWGIKNVDEQVKCSTAVPLVVGGLLEMLLKILDNGLKYWELGLEMVYYRNLRY